MFSDLHPMDGVVCTTGKTFPKVIDYSCSNLSVNAPIHSESAALNPQILRSKNNSPPTPCAHVDQQFAKSPPSGPDPATAAAMLHNP